MICDVITNVELAFIAGLLFKLVTTKTAGRPTAPVEEAPPTLAVKTEEPLRTVEPPIPSHEEIKRVDNNLVQLLVKAGNKWVHHSWRPAGHPDIQRALADPDMAVGYHDRIIIEQ